MRVEAPMPEKVSTELLDTTATSSDGLRRVSLARPVAAFDRRFDCRLENKLLLLRLGG